MIGSRRTPPTWLLAGLLIAAGVLAYANSLPNPFLFDDTGSIIDNQSIRSFTAATWRGPVQSAMAGRPVVNFSLAINYALGGLSPVGYHLSNLAVHLLCGLLLFGIVRRTLERREAPPASVPVRTGRRAAPGRRAKEDVRESSSASSWLAFACALLWLVHPLQTEVIDYVTQRTESMMGLAYLLTLYAAIRGWTAVAIAACALGMLTKESMVTAPVMVLLYDAVFVSGGVARAWRQRWPLYTGLAATWIILFAVIATGPRWRSAGFSSGVAPLTYLLNQPSIIVGYLRRTLWPTNLVLDYGLPHPIALADALPSAAVVLLLLALTVVAWFRRRELAYLGLWFFVTLAPTSSFVPIATEVGAERRMYLPLAALVILIVVAVDAGVRRIAAGATQAETGPPQRMVLGALLTVVACLLIGVTAHRNWEYATGTRIWQTVVDRHPSGRAHYNLGLSLKEDGRRDEALAHYQLALADSPDAHYALGFEFDADGDHQKAIEHYKEFIRLKPEDVNVIRAYNLLGRALVAEGRDDEAAPAFQQVLRMQPRNIDATGALGDMALRQGHFDAAIDAYQNYVRLAPQSAAARFNLGLALANAHRLEEAAGEFAEAVRRNPRQAAFRVNLAEALVGLGRLQEAVVHFSAAVQLEPDDQELFARMSEVQQAAAAKK